MTQYREILRMANESFSGRLIARTLSISRNTVSRTLKRSKEIGLTWPDVIKKSLEEDQVRALLFPAKESTSNYAELNFSYMEKELRKTGVTLQLLWMEYCDQARAKNKHPYMYSRFCDLYREYAQIDKVSMHIPRTPGQDVEVDWAGKTGFLKDPATGELVPVYIFVATMSYSQYAYAEGFLDQSLDSWITAHIHLFEFLSGVPKNIIPDNLKTGVKTPSFIEPDIQKNYQEMAIYYSTFIIPARVARPKDKPNVEASVRNLANNLLGKIRNDTFFTLEEFNEKLREHLNGFNSHAFQKKTGSRATLFFQEEKDLLTPLPKTKYELATWKTATIQPNYHVSVDGMFYSVPFQYSSKREGNKKIKTEVKITSGLIEIFYRDKRIASHPRLFGRKGQYQTVLKHMPDKHQKFLEWNDDRFINWAKEIGPNTCLLIKQLLETHVISQQAYRSCFGILRLADQEGEDHLEAVAEKALSFHTLPSYKLVKMLSQGLKDQPGQAKKAKPEESHAFLRNLRGDNDHE